MTLKYLSRTLPILKADETLPKVAQVQDDQLSQNSYVISQNYFLFILFLIFSIELLHFIITIG